MPERDRSSDLVRALERGLTVIRSFSPRHANMSVSEVAERTRLSRATARRILLTLENLGYVRCEGSRYSLRPTVLELGYAYLSSVHPWDAAFPLMEQLSEQVGENSLAGVRDKTDVICVARTTRRLVTVAVYVGGRVPAHASSMGRAILAFADDHDLDEYFAAANLKQITRHTVTSEAHLKDDLAQVREQGWSIVENELEEGLTSVSAPVFGTGEKVVAALNISAHGHRVSREDAEADIVPRLLACAREVSLLFGARLVRNAAQPTK